MEFTLPKERIEQQNYACAIHEAGHAVAAYVLGFGMRAKGMVLRDSRVKGCVDGVAYTRNPAIHCQNPKKREFFLKGRIVISFAGPVAEDMVHAFRGEIDQDVMSIAWALCELVPSQKQFFAGDNDGQNPYWNDLWALVCAQATSTKPERAAEQLDEYYEMLKELDGHTGPKIDPAIFDMLWPFAEQAHRLVNVHWSSVKRLACDLLKTRSLGREEIEARLPWAGEFVVR